MYKINKKALLDNFAAMVITIVALAIIFGVLFLILNFKADKEKSKIASDLNIYQGLYSTRIVLSEEISPDYKVYEEVIDYANSKNPDFVKEIYAVIKKFYPQGIGQDRWIIMINDNCFVIGENGQTTNLVVPSASLAGGAQITTDLFQDECDDKVITKMPKVTVPNPDGENILVLFKPQSYLDGETSRLFGYRADMLKGISSSSIPAYSLDGQTLEQIENIPNVECDASQTSFGKICAASEDVVNQLKIISADVLVRENKKIIITQAYRTREIQKKLYDDMCAKNQCQNGCNPDTNFNCPHMIAGAVDIVMLDENGKALNGQFGYNPALVEDIMCRYGFVRYHREDWHFEYGTPKWSNAETLRASGQRACTY